MATEKITGNPAEKPAEKAVQSEAGKSSGRRNGRREKPQGGQQNRSQQGAQRDKQQDSPQNKPQAETQSRPDRQAQERPGGEHRGARQSASRGGRSGERQNLRTADRRSGSSGRSGSSRPVDGTAVGKPAFNWTWRDYALQLSVVITGIVVTFAGSGLISRWVGQRQVRTVMQLVVSELEQNREMLRDVCSSLDYDRRGMLMFMEYDRLEDIPADSLAHYSLLLSYLPSYRPQQEALEVLKSSDIVSAVGDKQFLADIFGCYNRLNDFRENVAMYSGRKQDAQNHLFINTPGFSLAPTGTSGSWKIIFEDPLCAAFIGTSAYFFGGGDYFGRTIQAVDDVIASINNKYRF